MRMPPTTAFGMSGGRQEGQSRGPAQVCPAPLNPWGPAFQWRWGLVSLAAPAQAPAVLPEGGRGRFTCDLRLVPCDSCPAAWSGHGVQLGGSGQRPSVCRVATRSGSLCDISGGSLGQWGQRLCVAALRSAGRRRAGQGVLPPHGRPLDVPAVVRAGLICLECKYLG